MSKKCKNYGLRGHLWCKKRRFRKKKIYFTHFNETFMLSKIQRYWASEMVILEKNNALIVKT